MKKVTIYIVLVALVLLAGAALLRTQQSATEKVRVGVILPLTGPAAPVAEDLQKTLQMYEREARHITFVYQDDQCSGKDALAAYQLLKEQGVRVYVGACSGSILALAPVLKEDGNVLVTGFGGSIEIRNTGDEVIRFIPDGLSVVESMVALLLTNTDKQYALLHEQSDYPQSAGDVLETKLGARLVLRETYGANDMSMRTQLTKIKAAGVGAIIFIPVANSAAERVYQEMHELGMTQEIIGDVNVCDHSRPAPELGIQGSCVQTVLENAGNTAFLKQFEATYGAQPLYPFYNAITYDVAQTLDGALAGITVVDDHVIETLKQNILDGVQGSVMSYVFKENGDVVTPENYLKVVAF
ncbi:MAG: hypothetical protein RL150_542 [Candidatus Parcubacteria bacterium]|jgi:branched-chain amino acid transport system substrate-binding protein